MSIQICDGSEVDGEILFTNKMWLLAVLTFQSNPYPGFHGWTIRMMFLPVFPLLQATPFDLISRVKTHDMFCTPRG